MLSVSALIHDFVLFVPSFIEVMWASFLAVQFLSVVIDVFDSIGDEFQQLVLVVLCTSREFHSPLKESDDMKLLTIL